MERDCWMGAPLGSAEAGYVDGRNGSSSVASTLIVENGEDVLRQNLNGDYPVWTDEKHSLYLENLEVSFVKQLHQSMGSRTQYSEQHKRDYIYQTQTNNFHNVPEQSGYSRNIDHERGAFLSHNHLERSESYMIHGADDDGKEGTGQNFLDEDNHDTSNTKFHVKRLKNANSADSSSKQFGALSLRVTRM